jgi:3-hydroxyisobutyrate dehydrogenase-like beta-hydroxyacid dehydrogenase
MEGGSGRNIATRDWPSREALYKMYAADQAMLASNIEICRKDLALVLDLAHSAGVTLPVTEGLRSVVDDTPSTQLTPVWQHIARAN